MKSRILIAFPFAASFLLAGTASAEDGNVESGRQLYSARMCNLCHTLGGESGQMAQFGGGAR
jgi:mono/diheme cytochrome c family protein